MKLCKDCRHCDNKDRRCMHPKLSFTSVDYYNGASRIGHPTCQEARILCECGSNGALWEPQEIGFGTTDKG